MANPILDKYLLRYKWYRNWQARRSRVSLAKPAKTILSDKKVESYQPGDVMERERQRHERLLALRREQEAEREQERKLVEELYVKAEKEAKTNPSRTDEIFKERKDRTRRFKYSQANAFSDHVDEIVERLYNERSSKKG